MALPLASFFCVIPRKLTNCSIGTGLEDTLAAISVRTGIVAGDCTGLCVYQLAMNVR